MLRCVLDTNQIVGAGSRWLDVGPPKPPNCHLRILLLVFLRHQGLYTRTMLREYLRKLVEGGSPEERARRLIAIIVGAFEEVAIVSTHAPFPPADPDDEEFLLCALDGAADYLVSEDKHLRTLRNAYSRPVILRCAEALPIF